MNKRQKNFDIRLNLFGKEDFYLHMRPLTGKILLIIILMVSLSFFIHLSMSLFDHQNDRYKTLKVINDMSKTMNNPKKQTKLIFKTEFS